MIDQDDIQTIIALSKQVDMFPCNPRNEDGYGNLPYVEYGNKTLAFNVATYNEAQYAAMALNLAPALAAELEQARQKIKDYLDVLTAHNAKKIELLSRIERLTKQLRYADKDAAEMAKLARLQYIAAHDGQDGFDTYGAMIEIGMEEEYGSSTSFDTLINKMASSVFAEHEKRIGMEVR